MLCTKCGHALMENIQVSSFPVPDLLHTPRVLSQSEATLVRTNLSQVHTHISHLQNAIVRSRETTNELLRVRKVLSRYVKDNEAIFTPIERLPPELLSEIFVSLFPPRRSPKILDRKEVMRLGQVCSRWRKVALSTPELYTSMTIGPLRGSIESEVAILKAWLSRSRTLPLSLNFLVFSTDFLPVVDEAVAHSDRWQNIKLNCPVSSLSNLGVIKGHLRSLEHLKVALHGDLDTQSLQPIDVFKIAPRLRSLELVSPLYPRLFTIPWVQLTNFTLSTWLYGIGDCLDVLSRCPNLTTCILTWSHSESPLTIQHSPIRLLHLHSLQMKSKSEPSALFTHLTLPALRDCEYIHCDDDVAWNHSEFISLLSRSKCSLQRLVLCLNETFISDGDLIACLEHSPDLVGLEVLASGLCESSSTALDQLTNHNNGQAAFHAPKLKIITLLYHSTFDSWAFVNMVLSRWSPEEAIIRGTGDRQVPVERIKTVKLRFPLDLRDLADIDPEVLEKIQEIREAGLDIDIYDEDDVGCLEHLLHVIR